ncbi:ABC transporter substrate-binding protein [Rhodococcus sp. MS16]|nr:ABC transporter substrate-binding protein [Rhodococcus sp. MS16]
MARCCTSFKSRSVRSAIVGSGAALALLLTSCSGGAAGPSNLTGNPQSGGILTYSFNTDAQSVDPATCAIGIGLGPCQAVFGALMYYDPETDEFEPGMAESFSSEDGRVWTLKLRPALTFTDGTPFDAQAVDFNWLRLLDPQLLSPSAAVAKSITWEVVDSATIRVTSAEVNYQLPFAMSEVLAFVGSPTAIQEKGADFGGAPVGAGPFTMASWARGTEMVLNRNPTYWDQPRPYVDKLVVKTIPADDQRYNALQAGEINVMSVTFDKYVTRARSAGMNIVETPQLGGSGFRMSSNGALSDPDVRTAIAKLVDGEQLIAAIYPGEPVADTFAPESSPFYDPEARWLDQDVEGAQKLIDAYRARNNDKEVVVSFITTAGSPLLNQQAELLQAQLQRVNGLQLDIQPLDGAAFAAALTSGKYELILSALGGAHPENLYKVFHTNGASNTAGYSNSTVDAALDVTHNSDDPPTVNEAYKTAIRELVNTTAYRFWRPAISRLITTGSIQGVESAYQYWFRPELAWVEQ